MHSKILLFLILIGCTTAFGQGKKKSLGRQKASQQDQFLNKQWWLGFKAGANWSQADPIKRYTILTPTDYEASQADKKYKSFGATGSQASVEITFQYNHFMFSTQPTYRQSRYTYSNSFRYVDTEDPSQSLTLNYGQEQKVIYADVPLIVKYSFLDGSLRPYVQLGVYYSFLINATQTVTVSGIDVASGGTNEFKNEPVIVGTKDLFDNYWSIGAGGGVTWQMGNVQVVLEANYRRGMSNIANVDNRFSSDRLSGIGDVQDDVKLSNIVVSAGVLFPMRFLNNNFKSRER